MYVGDKSKYGMKLVSICQGSMARTLEIVYTKASQYPVMCLKGIAIYLRK